MEKCTLDMAQDVKSCKLVAHLWKETTMRSLGGAQVTIGLT